MSKLAGFNNKKFGRMKQALFCVAQSVNKGSSFDTLDAEVATYWSFEDELNKTTAKRLFGSTDPDRSLCVEDKNGFGQFLESRPAGTAKRDFLATPTQYLVEALMLFEPMMDITQPDTPENLNKEKREQLLGLNFTSTSTHTNDVEFATLHFHQPFDVAMINETVEENTGVHTIPDWMVASSLEEMRKRKILFISGSGRTPWLL